MGGGKSSSNQESSQTTTTKSVDAVAGGDILQGETITVTEYFPEGVQEAFQQLVGLASKSIDLSRDAGTAAIETIANTKTELANPQLVEQKQTSPVLYIMAFGVILYLITRKQ